MAFPMKKTLPIVFAVLLCASLTFAQEHAAEPAKAESQKASETKPEPAAGEQQQASGHERGAASEPEHTAPSKGAQEEDQHTKLTQSAVVKKLAGYLHISPKQAYWGFVLVNFVALAWGLRALMKNGLEGLFPPIGQVFRDRATAIQKGMEEARKASAESTARLTEIESRLARLDTEIVTMRTQAEAEAHAEEERLKAATEEEKRKIVHSAEQEIAAAAGAARRELKNLAVELAVALAEKKISVTEETDRVLVRDFAAGLDGKGGN